MHDARELDESKMLLSAERRILVNAAEPEPRRGLPPALPAIQEEGRAALERLAQAKNDAQMNAIRAEAPDAPFC